MSDQPIPLFQVLIEEYNKYQPAPHYKGLEDGLKRYQADGRDEETCKRINSEEVRKFYSWLHRDAAPKRSALCFSGGGIRSATFGLGVVQGLARMGLLSQFDFISTVSGGGYLGSWLSAWIHRKGVKKVQERLKNQPPPSPLAPEPDPIVHLRSYSNYMTPKLGLLSADTWTLVAIFLRNMILNWLVLIPPLLLVLMVPRFCVAVIRKEPVPPILLWLRSSGANGTFWIAVAAGIVSIAYIYANRPSLADPYLRGAANAESVFSNRLKSQGWFLLICLAPLLLLAVCVTTYYAWLGDDPANTSFSGFGNFISNTLHGQAIGISLTLAQSPLFAFVSFGLILSIGGLLLSLPWMRSLRGFPRELLIALFIGVVGGSLTWLMAAKVFSSPTASVFTYVCFAAPTFLVVYLLGGTLFAGVSSRFTSDADREWMARSGAWILISCIAWILVSAIVIFGPPLLVYAVKTVVPLGTVSGVITLVLGHSGRTSATTNQSSATSDRLLMVAAPLFAVFILICLSLGTSWLIVELQNNVGGLPALTSSQGLLDIIGRSSFSVLLELLAGFLLIGTSASWLININKFSLHGAYRDRLIRAYLGASRIEEERKPNPFTGLDEKDNLQMQQLRTQLFHDDNVRNLGSLVSTLKQTGLQVPQRSWHLLASRHSAAKVPQNSISAYLWSRLSEKTQDLIRHHSNHSTDVEAALKYSLFDDLNRILQGQAIFEEGGFASIELTAEIKNLAAQNPRVETLRLNRLLLQQAYPEIFRPVPMSKPLHVVNVTLNLVGGKNLAWQNRQAESFTVSALHAGSYCVGYRDSRDYGRNRNNEAISLGTAAAISGAAVSPNMGYYSSTFVTFLLALFNLRLGWWLGNPGRAGNRQWGISTYDTAGPNFAARPLIEEMLGLTDDQHPYVYLSDGGHFENLGLYEMVLRRCKMIIVSDGSADANFELEGLGTAISKIRVDLGVPIEIQEIAMLPRDEDLSKRGYGEMNPKFRNRYCAVGRICYSCIDRHEPRDDAKKYDGILIYIKAFLSGTEPVDVYNYARTQTSFPHESTADQMYSESQFESYRALGSHMVEKICENVAGPTTVDNFFDLIEHQIGLPPECN